MEQIKNIPRIIAIDGPAASGKSSVGQNIAEQLGYMFLDTGIMYRAVTYAVIERNIEPANESQVGDLAKHITIELRKPSRQNGRLFDLCVDGEDITDQLRSSVVNASVSLISRYAAVRDAMTAQQKQIGENGRIVMAGRDIGTVVLPDADLKVYLEASSSERARRRYEEEKAKGNNISFQDILENVKMRDEIDSTRKIAPLKPAHDAHIINTDGKNIEEVTAEIMQIIKQ